MATVVKNFRIKQGLVVEGSTGTINGQNILTETGGDAYILNLVGGTNLINSVESTQMEVIAGELNIKSGVFDTAGAAAAAQSAAEATASADATSKANAAQSAAASDATTKANAAQAAAEATAQSALNAVKDGTTKFTAVNVNDVAITKAATTTVSSASTVNALTWAAADYRTAKALVKFKNGANTQVSEILLTLDTSNNVAITEFGSIGTNGDLGSISAAYVSGNVSISVTTVYASTDVMVYATLIK